MITQKRPRRGGGWLWQFLHAFTFTRALFRGPRYFTKYEGRRQLRRTMFRALGRW